MQALHIAPAWGLQLETQAQHSASAAHSNQDSLVHPFVSLNIVHTARLLLQSGQQQHTADVVHQDRNDSTTAAADVTDAEVASSVHATAKHSPLVQYKSRASPLIDEQKLIDAAAGQASQFLTAQARSAGVRTNPTDLDTWPLVNPPFEMAMHEVGPNTATARYCLRIVASTSSSSAAVLWQQ